MKFIVCRFKVSMLINEFTVRSTCPDVGTVQHLFSEPYHNGVRVHWQGHNYVDSQGISYAVQVARDDQEFITVYRG